jgi:Tfp pilus assembly protein PilF
VGYFRAALAARPDSAGTHLNLGGALRAQGRPKEAEAAYREALRLKPDLPEAHSNLGSALSVQGLAKEAEAEFREALRLKPDLPETHCNLGNALLVQRRVKEAEAAYREALRLKFDRPEVHCNLGLTLRQQGRFAEALACLKRGHELGTRQPRWRYPSGQWVRDAERLAALDRKLAAVLKGQARPADAAEQLGLADVCRLTKRYATAVRFYADAFAADPKLSDDLRAGHRYDAACYAALAAAGQGTDAPKPDAKGRARLRGQALGWLRADLALWQKQADSGKADSRVAAQRALRHWQQDADLAGVRDRQALAALPAEEPAEWEKLWADVADLLHHLDAAKPAAAPPGK